jgi:hypothetical protein
LAEPTSADIAREAEADAAVFAQAANIDKLLTRLRSFDISKDNLVDDEEVQVREIPCSVSECLIFYRNYIAQAWVCAPKSYV